MVTAHDVPTTTNKIAEDSMSQIAHDPQTRCLEGTLNFRDIGGLPADPGQRIRNGQLFRSDPLQFLTESDVDLRLGYEVRIEGRGLLGDTHIAYHHLAFVVRSSQRTGTAPIKLPPKANIPRGEIARSSMVMNIGGCARVVPRRGPARRRRGGGNDQTDRHYSCQRGTGCLRALRELLSPLS